MKYTRFYDSGYMADRYRRSELLGDVLYSAYQFGGMLLLFPKQNNTATAFTDTYARQMVSRGIVTQSQLSAYENAVCREFAAADSHADLPAQQVYRLICQLRQEMFGAAAMEKAREADKEQPATPAPFQGICENDQKERLLRNGKKAVFVLYQAQYFQQLLQDMETARQAGQTLYLLVSDEEGDALPTQETCRRWLGDLTNVQYLCTYPTKYGSVLENVQWDARLQTEIDNHQATVFAYGEEALLSCRSLQVDAIVTARPQGYCAKAITNQLGCDGDCTVYVPKHLDITQFVPLTEKTRLSYWHLATLRREYGDLVDTLTLEELYRRYPAYFLNRYENGTNCPESADAFPIRVTIPAEEPDPVGSFDGYREEAIAKYLGGLAGVQYQCAYFDPQLNRTEVPWNAKEPQGGILVHSVRVQRAKGSKVIRCGSGVTLRQKLQQELPAGNGIVSNFLFFLTPKLATLYNALRQDRPLEQAQLGAEHLDYMLNNTGTARKETFPLFRKTCIAMQENGEFLFFNFRLGGGKVRIGDQWIRWESRDVDPVDPGDVCIYTPYASTPDGNADRQTYRKLVGQGRVNFVLLQDRIHCVRSGDVVLPSVGVVLSLEKQQGETLLKELNTAALQDGYYAVDQLPLEIRLDPPAGISETRWEQLRWAYGGGLSLILDHKAVTDREDMLPWFEEEGWMSPLSRQTQESTLHKLAKHPRTAIGVADNGDLLILVFSGRTRLSTGADYGEMCRIARTLYPDVHSLMNADGGGSAVLGLLCQGEFMELSYPSTSNGSTVGMARPIQTAFYISQEVSL